MSTNMIKDLITQLSSSDWENRQKAADTLAILGEAAKDALPQLKNQFIDDDDPDVRVSIVKAISKIEQDKAAVIKELLGSLGHTDSEVRSTSADMLGGLGAVAKETLDSLWTRLLTDEDDDVVTSVARAIAGIDEDKPALLSKCVQFLQEGSSKKSLAAAIMLGYLEPASIDHGKASDALWAAIERSEDLDFIRAGLKSLIRLAPNTTDVIARLIDDPKISIPKKSDLILLPELLDSLEETWPTKISVIVPLLVDQLGRHDIAYRNKAIQWLAATTEDLPSEFIDPIVKGLSESYRHYGLGFSLLKDLGAADVADQLLNDPDIAPEIVGRTLLTEAQEALNEKWNKDKQTVLPLILASLTTRNWDVLKAALGWLKDKAGDIPRDSHKDVVEAVANLQNARIHPEVRNIADAALIQLRQQERDIKTSPLVEVIRGSAKEDAKVEAIERLVEMGTRDALRALVNEWVQWIARGDKALVEVTADLMRSKPIAVQPLVDQLLHEWQPDGELRTEIRYQLPPIEFREILRSVYDGYRLESLTEKSLVNEWLLTVAPSSEKIIDLKKASLLNKWSAEKLAKEVIDILVTDEIRVRDLKIQFRVAKQLADMSDPKFFEEEASKDIHQKIRDELKRHAVPILGRRLPKEENVEIRESMAQALGYIGGRESIDALSRAVAGEERLRTARQELLAKYYLEPSKARSEEAANILKEAADEAKRTLRLQHRLNVAIFIVGLVILTAGLITSMFVADTTTRIVGALAGLGGAAGFFTLMIKAPIDRVQHAMANLVQIETAFTSFIWELNLNGTYIQSQYVAEGVLTDNEISQTVGRIEDAMNLAMNLVAVYTQDRGQRVVTRINNLLPAAGAAGSIVTIAGQHLHGDSGGKKEQAGIIAVDHTYQFR